MKESNCVFARLRYQSVLILATSSIYREVREKPFIFFIVTLLTTSISKFAAPFSLVRYDLSYVRG